MMQSVPAHTFASWDALRYLVINYIYSCSDACLRLGGHKYKTIRSVWEACKRTNYSPSVFVQLSLHHAFGVESWGLSDFVFSKVNLGEILLRMLLPISKRMAYTEGVDESIVVKMADYLQHHLAHNSIPDPYYGTERDFELVIELLEDACQNLLHTLEQDV